MRPVTVLIPVLISVLSVSSPSDSRLLATDAPWRRHTIDHSSRGADGVRLADANGDGHLDITTGWEEGGIIRVYLNPGPQSVTLKWPAVTVGKVKSPEDAVFADLDGDGAVDVVSSCEGKTRTMFIHWAPSDGADYLRESAWTTQAIPCTQSSQMWMFALPLDVDGLSGIDVVVGSKGNNGSIGWLESPADPRDISAWKYHRLRDSGWIMSLIARDMDDDGDDDVIASDRKGPNRRVLWLENPGQTANQSHADWTEHRIGGDDSETMFIDVHSPREQPDSPPTEIFSATKPIEMRLFMRASVSSGWQTRRLLIDDNASIGTAKSVRIADVDLNDKPDIVYSCEQADGQKHGVFWFSPSEKRFHRHPISGPEGVKFDLLQLVDLDADGDLDVITCEERANLGVIWYENPTR
ncbi:VCBS repeat-containing protein [bacterium]|nr:VCBS repeat-containing protein [bacterium]